MLHVTLSLQRLSSNRRFYFLYYKTTGSLISEPLCHQQNCFTLKVGAITAAVNRIYMPLTRLRSIEPGDILRR